MFKRFVSVLCVFSFLSYKVVSVTPVVEAQLQILSQLEEQNEIEVLNRFISFSACLNMIDYTKRY